MCAQHVRRSFERDPSKAEGVVGKGEGWQQQALKKPDLAALQLQSEETFPMGLLMGSQKILV